ncbi:MAG: ABC transporter ATP-binding protein [Planctomycetes bacterium]|nr:ABC transporter ATP-binding protein [Planctomycetota bacterium]
MSTANVLVLRGVRKGFASPDGGRVEVVDVEALELAAGEQAALRGSSGTGKTTLLHMIAGLVRPDAGSIWVAGHDIARLSEVERDAWRARHIGYVFQSFHLLQAFTALENVALASMFAGRAQVERARELLERVGLGARLEYLPRKLSIGQQQRVAVARALVNRPSLVLADEPTGNLDRSNADAALALIREACRESGAALLVVSHDERIVERFERVLDLGHLARPSAGGVGA